MGEHITYIGGVLLQTYEFPSGLEAVPLLPVRKVLGKDEVRQ